MHAAFERDGWAIVRGALGADEVAAIREVFTTLVPDVAYPPGPDGVIQERAGLARYYEPLAALTRDPRLGSLAAQALGAARVQLLQDSLLFKPARDGGQVGWHQDYSYIGYLVPARVATIRIALEPEDESNGCMHVVDGSHAWGLVTDDLSLRETSIASLERRLDEAQRARLAHARPLVLAPGDVSIHHCLTVHGSARNPSARPRRTIILRMFDGACRLDASRLPPGAESYFPTTPEGSLATELFPVVHASNRER